MTLMTPDWSLVTLEHVRQACALYDAGAAIPRRSAQTTFLVWDGKTYPAKFIRGLAYRLAIGTELDPLRDYSGGQETVRFFRGLGLPTQHDSPSGPPTTTAVAGRAKPPALEPVPVTSVRRLEPQKQALADLLRRRFGTVVTEAEFPWLTVPRRSDMDESIAGIHDALRDMRGRTDFAATGRSLRCDFFVPGERLIVEYDERQHFTLQRAKALEVYPPEVALGFDRDDWIAACRSIRATDPDPPYRDEQRAFYDSLRDILAARNAVRLVRLRDGTFDWTGTGTDEHLGGILSGGGVLGRSVPAVPGPAATLLPGPDRISRLSLISHDYNVPDSLGHYDYSEHFAQINRLCDAEGCDTILYALYTWDRRSPVLLDHDAIFRGLTHVHRVILEIGQPPVSFEQVQVWVRGCQAPVLAQQRFASSSAPRRSKQAFLGDLDQRRIADAVPVLCGETNIASLVRGSDRYADPYRFSDRLREMDVRLVLNPIHDYMRRYEMRRKRRYYSHGGRTVISVWNQGRRKEAHMPWTVFHDGGEKTDAVRELHHPIGDRVDIRIGIIDVGVP